MIKPSQLFEKYNQVGWVLHSKLLYSHSNSGGSSSIGQSVIVLDQALNETFWFLYIKESMSQLNSDELAILLSELDQLDFKKPILFDPYINLYDAFCQRTLRFLRIKQFEPVRAQNGGN